MLFDCKYFKNAFEKENCSFSTICGESKCYFANKKIIEDYESQSEELGYLQNDYDGLKDTIDELESDNKQLECANEELEEKIKDIKKKVLKIIEYVREKYDNEFRLEDVL